MKIPNIPSVVFRIIDTICLIGIWPFLITELFIELVGYTEVAEFMGSIIPYNRYVYFFVHLICTAIFIFSKYLQHKNIHK